MSSIIFRDTFVAHPITEIVMKIIFLYLSGFSNIYSTSSSIHFQILEFIKSIMEDFYKNSPKQAWD